MRNTIRDVVFSPNSFGHSFVLAATDHLRQKILKLEARMHSLEDAIAIIHDSSVTHPLLTSLGVGEDEEDGEEPILQPVDEESGPSTLLDALGTLHIDGHGGARFFGPSGGSEVCRLGIHRLSVSYLILTCAREIFVEFAVGRRVFLCLFLNTTKPYDRKRRI